jgi:SAM-dependent methyltransferase
VNLLQIAKMGTRSLLRDLPLWMQFRLGLKTSADIDNAVTYAIQLSDHYLTQLASRGISLNGTRILEIGPGLDFAPQLVLASQGAKLILADRFLSKWDQAYHPEFYRRFKARWTGPSTAIDEAIAAGGYPASLISCLAEPAEALNSVATASCDVVFSTSVLEHVYDLPVVCRSLARVTKPGGIGLHSIDFRDHWNFDRPLDFLLFASQSYQARMTRGRVGRGNRLRLSEHLAQFRDAGFRIDTVKPYAPPDKGYFDAFLPRLRASSSPYRDSPLDDLLVLGAMVTVVRETA